MSEWQIDEQQLLEINSYLTRADDVLVHICIPRTAQESKLFPMLSYLDAVFFDTYYRYPDLLRKATQTMSPETLGHRARESTTTLTRVMCWGMLNWYLNGRSFLIRNGLMRAEDNLEDLHFMVDFHHRFMRAYERSNGGHIWALDASDTDLIHEERTLQVFEADAFEADDALRKATKKFLAVGTQYNFLVHCESRAGLAACGPYNLGGRRLMHTRDFLNMTECGFVWMDGIGTDLPYANLTMTLITEGVGIEITDFSTPYTTPEDYQDAIIGVGLYTSDVLTDRYIPVGMGSAAELTNTLNELSDAMVRATRELYKRFSAMSFDEMVEAGLTCTIRGVVDATIMAGCYVEAEWNGIEERARRLLPVYSEEYSLDAYVDKFMALTGQRASQTEYYLHPITYDVWRRGSRTGDLPVPGRDGHLVPADVLRDHDYSRRANPNGLADCKFTQILPEKTGAYTFSSGRLTESEVNERARAHVNPFVEEPWRHLDEQTVKWRWEDPEVDAMYRYAQEHSRLLSDKGSSLRRADIDAVRAEAGERPWHEVAKGAALEATPTG
jgi:hypothetical protein